MIEDFPIKRNMDGIYFCIKRGEQYESICFSDLTEKEMDMVMTSRNEEWFKAICKVLAKSLRNVGDVFELERE